MDTNKRKMGRPAEYVEETNRLRPRTVSLDDKTARILAAYGNGVLSAGIRLAARVVAAYGNSESSARIRRAAKQIAAKKKGGAQ